jgi:[acyl-carrier-protein] S-malonyltransferase
MTLAFVFPGQGSQTVGMLSDSAASVADSFNEASEALGYDLWALVQQGPEAQLNQTEFTQPALLTASVALWRLWNQSNTPINFLAGHSLGEYSALVAAGVMSLAEGARIVQTRGRLMQEAVPIGEGGMAAIMGLTDQQIAAACVEAEARVQAGRVQPANLNAPGQVVISGTTEALNAAISLCQEAGAKRAIALNVSAPFHSELMRPAAEQLASSLEQIDFQAPTIPVLQNVLAAPCEDPEEIKSNLITQMFSAVRWTETIEYLEAQGVTSVVECGPGKVLSGLNRRISKAVSVHNLDSDLAATELKAVV